MLYDAEEIKKQLTIDNIYELLTELGGEPEYTNFGLIARTICHNKSGEGSRKLYYYNNSNLFKCYTECDSTFDIFTLIIKVMKIQKGIEYNFYDSLVWISNYFNIFSFINEKEDKIEDWKFLDNYSRIKEIKNNNEEIILKEYNNNILKNLNYNIKITPWINENISEEIMRKNQIGYYSGQDCITIPHFDINNRFVGLRGRTLIQENADLYGKYRPLKINNVLYSHPLGLNLYNLNNSKDNIKRSKNAIIFEAEKSTMKLATYFGIDNDISVACCGSSISSYQIKLLLSLGVQEITIAFDRQFKDIGDHEFQLLKKKLINLHNKYKNYVTVSLIFDKNMITSYKASPIDEGKEKFLQLFKDRIYL